MTLIYLRFKLEQSCTIIHEKQTIKLNSKQFALISDCCGLKELGSHTLMTAEKVVG